MDNRGIPKQRRFALSGIESITLKSETSTHFGAYHPYSLLHVSGTRHVFLYEKMRNFADLNQVDSSNDNYLNGTTLLCPTSISQETMSCSSNSETKKSSSMWRSCKKGPKFVFSIKYPSS